MSSCCRFSRRTKLLKPTAEFLADLSIEHGTDGLFAAAGKIEQLAETESDRALAGALMIMRWVLLGFARDLESNPDPEIWGYRKTQLDALIAVVRNRDPEAFANFATFPS